MWDQLKRWLGRREHRPGDTPPAAQAPPEVPAGTDGESLREAYAVFELEEGADLNTVRRVWKRKLREVHRDHYSDDPEVQRRAQETTRRLNEAYQRLRDALF